MNYQEVQLDKQLHILHSIRKFYIVILVPGYPMPKKIFLTIHLILIFFVNGDVTFFQGHDGKKKSLLIVSTGISF